MVKPITLRTRVTVKEHGLLNWLAQRENLNASEFVRLAIHEAAKARGIPAVGMAELPALNGAEVGSEQPQQP
jgi:hypothetical protein